MSSSPQSLKEEGNTLFLAKKFQEAIDKYTEALNLISSSPSSDSSSTSELKTVLLSNRAQCNLDLFKWLQAVNDATNALEINPYHTKSIFRAATAFSRLVTSEGADTLPRQRITALHLCEFALSKPEVANALSQTQKEQFGKLYEELVVKEQDRYKQVKDSHVHHLNSPLPLVCFVCKGFPKFEDDNIAETKKNNDNNNVAEKSETSLLPPLPSSSIFDIMRLGIRCKCSAATFCCRGHQAVAAKEHEPVCSLLGVVEDMSTNDGDSSDDSTTMLPLSPTGKDVFSNLSFLRAVLHLFRSHAGRKEAASEFEQLRQIPRCVGCGYFPAQHGCKKCSMVSFCGAGGVCVERGLKNLTKEQTGGRTIKKQNLHTPGVCRALLETAKASHLAYLYPKPSYSTFYTMMDLVLGNPPGRSVMIRRENFSLLLLPPPQVSSCEQQEGANNNNNNTSNEAVISTPSPESLLETIMTLYQDFQKEDPDSVINANFLYRKYISPFTKTKCQLEASSSSSSSSLNNSSLDVSSASLTFDSLICDSYSWPLSLFYGLMRGCPQEARDRLKQRLSLQHPQAVEFDRKNTLVVHIIGAENEAFALPCFEEILHLLAGWEVDDDEGGATTTTTTAANSRLVKHLHLVCVGPGVGRISEARQQVVTASMKDFCSDCKKEGFTVTFHWRAAYYEDFCDEMDKKFVNLRKVAVASSKKQQTTANQKSTASSSSKNNTEKNNNNSNGNLDHLNAVSSSSSYELPLHPHVCILFNAGINENADEEAAAWSGERTWHPGLAAMLHQPQCIHIVTSYDIGEAKQDRQILLNVLAREKKKETVDLEKKKLLKSLVVEQPISNPFRTPLVKKDPTRWNGVTYGAQSDLFTVW